jgi:hypothetical protein
MLGVMNAFSTDDGFIISPPEVRNIYSQAKETLTKQ